MPEGEREPRHPGVEVSGQSEDTDRGALGVTGEHAPPTDDGTQAAVAFKVAPAVWTQYYPCIKGGLLGGRWLVEGGLQNSSDPYRPVLSAKQASLIKAPFPVA